MNKQKTQETKFYLWTKPNWSTILFNDVYFETEVHVLLKTKCCPCRIRSNWWQFWKEVKQGQLHLPAFSQAENLQHKIRGACIFTFLSNNNEDYLVSHAKIWFGFNTFHREQNSNLRLYQPLRIIFSIDSFSAATVLSGVQSQLFYPSLSVT